MEIREIVKEKYEQAALRFTAGKSNGCCGGSGRLRGRPNHLRPLRKATKSWHPRRGHSGFPRLRKPAALAQLKPGKTVLDLASGGGIDLLLSTKRVGPTGKA